jgi:uridine kinase
LKKNKIQMLIIGIAGGTGSGKTTVVKKIISSLPESSVTILSQDSYYRDNSDVSLDERKKINFDHPNSIEFELLTEHLSQLAEGKSIREPIYSYLSCTRSSEYNLIEPRDIIIVEGILVLTQPELRKLFDLKIFVYADADDRLSRVIRRDIVERGRNVADVLQRYAETVKPMHEQFIEPSMRYADLIVPEGGHNTVAIDVLVTLIEKNLKL